MVATWLEMRTRIHWSCDELFHLSHATPKIWALFITFVKYEFFPVTPVIASRCEQLWLGDRVLHLFA